MRIADDSIFSLLLLLITIFWSRRQHHAVEAFSANPPPSSTGSSSSRQFIELQDLTASSSSSSSSLPSQQLPVSFVEQWPTWVLDTSGVWSKIPDSSDGDADADDAAAAAGFVQPTSVDTMFQPIDLKTPTHFQLALGFHVRQGTIRHVMPALDISFEGGQHRNRGLCSVPRAYKWIDFNNGMFGGWKDFEMRALVRKQQQQQQQQQQKGKEDGGSDDDDDDDGAEEWEEITSSTRPCGGDIIAKAIERTIFSLAQSPPAELEEGSHLVHVLLTDEETDDNEVDSSPPYCLQYPKTGHEICVVLDDRQKGDIPIQNLQVEGQGILHVTTFATMAGSESEFLPDAYKPLFHDKTLRNPLYERYKERRQQEKQ